VSPPKIKSSPRNQHKIAAMMKITKTILTTLKRLLKRNHKVTMVTLMPNLKNHLQVMKK
jgi:hypothetical protein